MSSSELGLVWLADAHADGASAGIPRRSSVLDGGANGHRLQRLPSRGRRSRTRSNGKRSRMLASFGLRLLPGCPVRRRGA